MKTDSEIQVRLAQAHELRATRMLLPEISVSVRSRLAFVGLVGFPQSLVGAAVLVPWPLGAPPGFRLALRVAKPFRGRGLGTALVKAAIDETRRRQIRGLYITPSVLPDSEEAKMWAALGFTSHVSNNHYETNPRRIVEMLTPLCEKMRMRGWIPDNARVIPLSDAPAREIARMHAQCLGGTPRGIMGRILGGGPNRFDPRLSQVLMIDDRVCGFLLSHLIESTISYVDAVVVAPDLRLGWANTLLKLHNAKQSVACGRKATRYVAHDVHGDTRSMSARAGARLIKTMLMPYREVAPLNR